MSEFSAKILYTLHGIQGSMGQQSTAVRNFLNQCQKAYIAFLFEQVWHQYVQIQQNYVSTV